MTETACHNLRDICCPMWEKAKANDQPQECLLAWSFQKPSPFQPNMFPFAMSLTNEQIEEQLMQLADALAQMSEMTATAFEQRDKEMKALKDKVAALESQSGGQ